MVVLGLVTTKRGELEAKDELKRRIEEASAVRAASSSSASRRSAASPRRVEGNDLSYEQQVAKLRLVVETAQEVWG